MDHLKKQKNFDIMITEKRKEVNHMSKNYSDAEGCAIVIVGVVFLALIYFGMPWVCIMGWKPIAAAFSLPVFEYWDWFWMSWLIRWLFKSSSGASLTRNKG